MPDPTDVVLTRIEGRLETLTATSELRLHVAEQTATKAAQAAEAAHDRIDVHDRQMARAIGIGLGIGIASGAGSGVVVTLLTNPSLLAIGG